MSKDFASFIQQNEQLDLTFERIDKIDVPLLVIGLGGTGADAVRTIKETFAQRFNLPVTADGKVLPIPERTGYLIIDSDMTGKDGFDESELVGIGAYLPPLLRDPDHKNLSQSQKRWLHRNLHRPEDGCYYGSRATTRLMLDLNFESVYTRIRTALLKLSSPLLNSGIPSRPHICVVTGICGSTGSGLFLDIAQMIRNMMQTDPAFIGMNYTLNSYIVMPDVSIYHMFECGGAEAMVDIFKRTSYAALKELDYWMDYDRHKDHYEMEFSCGRKILWKKPFDNVTLMCGTNVVGHVFEGSYQLVQRTIAETLLHYMANENPNRTAQGNAQYSFLSYENNLDAQSSYCRHTMTLPLNHAYRAVGAYSKRIPKKKILFYEGSLLFKTFMPLRNEHGKLVPNDGLLRDGNNRIRFQSIVQKSFNNLYQEFCRQAVFPPIYADFSASTRTMVENVRSYRTPGHQAFQDWQQNVIAPTALTFAENYRKSVWQRFAEMCKEIMSDPDYGPFSLQQYLKHESVSLRVEFSNFLNGANSAMRNLHESVNDKIQACNATYQHFLSPPLLGGTAAVQRYLDALKILLDTVRQYEFARQYAHVMDMLCKSIDAYIADALDPLCRLIEDLEADFRHPSNVADSLGSDLFDVSTLHDEINSNFASLNIEGALSRSFLGKLCESTFEFEPNVETAGCGMTFLFKKNGRLKALQIMKEEMDAGLTRVNSMSLDSIMMLKCQDDDTAAQTQKQQKYITDLAQSVVKSANPLFSLTATHTGIKDHVAKALYFSVPEDATTFLNYLSPGGTPIKVEGISMTPKASSLTDHIYCNITWDVLPLYSYTLMDDLKHAYDDAFRNDPDGASAIHLVWNGDADSDYRQNWCLLPSPAPYYLFGADTDSQSDKREYKSARELVMRALNCGMLTIDSTVAHPLEKPAYTFRIFRSAQNTLHNTIIQEKLQQLLASKDPVTGAPLNAAKLLEVLKGFVNEAARETIAAVKSPIVMNRIVGIDDSTTNPINPFESGLEASNPDAYNKACENFYTLTVEYAVHVLLQTPKLITDVAYQIESFEAIGNAIRNLEENAKLWEPRIAYAKTFAELYEYGLIGFTADNRPNYEDASGKTSILIQPHIFKSDLEHCSKIVKAVAVAADLTAEHEIRKHLEGKLHTQKQLWKQHADTDSLTPELIADHLTRLNELLADVVMEHADFVATKQTDYKADHELLSKYIALLEGVQDYIKKQISYLKAVQPVPSDTWTCPRCGKTGLTGMFCDTCGTKKREPDATWTCPGCGKTGLTGMFCDTCGTKKREPDATWICPGCGKTGLTGMFCDTCGTKKPDPNATWTCTCGNSGLSGMFCDKCGTKRPN